MLRAEDRGTSKHQLPRKNIFVPETHIFVSAVSAKPTLNVLVKTISDARDFR